MKKMRRLDKGFTLIQIAIDLTAVSLLAVTLLPNSSVSPVVDKNKTSVTKMDAILYALRQYEASNSALPCPADPNLAIGDANYGVAATAYRGTTNNCV